MKKSLFFKILIIYCSTYFLLSFILYSSLGIAILSDYDKQSIKEDFNQLDEYDILFIYRDKIKFKPSIVVVYKDSKSDDRYHCYIRIKDEYPHVIEINNKINNNDITKYLWYFNLVNLLILLITYIVLKRKKQTII